MELKRCASVSEPTTRSTSTETASATRGAVRSRTRGSLIGRARSGWSALASLTLLSAIAVLGPRSSQAFRDESRKHRRVVDEVATPQPRRLVAEAVQPFEAGLLHPARRTRHEA